MILKKILSPVSDALDRVCSVLIVGDARPDGRHHHRADRLPHVLHLPELVGRVTRYLLIWSTFLAQPASIATAATSPSPSFRIWCPKARLDHAHRGACDLLRALRRAAVYSCKYCGKLVKTATALPIKMKYIYLCIPISMGVLMPTRWSWRWARLKP